jgi:hypothetical protein
MTAAQKIKAKDSMELAKEKLLPKMLNLHTMTTTTVECNIEPRYMEVDGVNKIIASRVRFDITLQDFTNDITAVITIYKHHGEE